MAQYRTLATHNPNDGIWFIEFSRDLEIDPQTGNWRKSPDADSISASFQALLCRYFDPQYACNPVVAFAPETGKSDMNMVASLKTVEWIVLRSKLDENNISAWKTRFPYAKVLAWQEWERMDPKPNTPE